MVKIPVPDPIPQLEIELSRIPSFRLDPTNNNLPVCFRRPKLSSPLKVGKNDFLKIVSTKAESTPLMEIKIESEQNRFRDQTLT